MKGNLLTSLLQSLVTTQSSKFVPYMEVFLIDSRDQNKLDQQIKFFRQAEQNNLFHLIDFLKQFSTMVLNLLHLKRLQQTSWLTLLFNVLNVYSRFSR